MVVPIDEQKLYEEAVKIVDPVIKDEKKKIQLGINNLAFYTTIITVWAYVIMYAYKSSYFFSYNIPLSNIKISLTDFLPFLFQLCLLTMFVLWYVIMGILDLSYGRKPGTLNTERVFWGTGIAVYLLSNIGFYEQTSWWFGGIITVALSLGVEIFAVHIAKPRKFNGVVSDNSRDLALKRMVKDELFHRLFHKTGISILFVAVVFSFLVGKIVTIFKTEYELCDYHGEKYAIIIDYGESAIFQKAEIDGSQLFIETESYIYDNKEGLSISTSHFEKVIIMRAPSNMQIRGNTYNCIDTEQLE